MSLRALAQRFGLVAKEEGFIEDAEDPLWRVRGGRAQQQQHDKANVVTFPHAGPRVLGFSPHSRRSVLCSRIPAVQRMGREAPQGQPRAGNRRTHHAPR